QEVWYWLLEARCRDHSSSGIGKLCISGKFDHWNRLTYAERWWAGWIGDRCRWRRCRRSDGRFAMGSAPSKTDWHPSYRKVERLGIAEGRNSVPLRFAYGEGRHKQDRRILWARCGNHQRHR